MNKSEAVGMRVPKVPVNECEKGRLHVGTPIVQ